MGLFHDLKSVLKSTFLQSTGVLVSGAVLANLVTALSLPVLTRLYTPADFSALAVLTALVATLSVAIALRLDVAVPLPENDDDAANVAALALCSTIVLSAIVAVVFVAFPRAIAGLLNQPAMQSQLILVPIGVLFAGVQSVLQFWMVRTKQFPGIAQVKVMQSSLASGGQITASLAGAGTLGLLTGPVVNAAAGCAGALLKIWRMKRDSCASVNLTEMRRQLGLYRQFPRYSALEALANSAAIQVPILMIAALAAKPEAGFLLLGMAAMQAPMALIGAAVAQVYFSQAPEEHRAGRLAPFTADVLSGLIKSGVGPIIFIGIVAPEIFSLIFGETWRRSGVLVGWMTPWFVMQFLASPISTSLLITGALRTALSLQVFGLVLRVLIVAVTAVVAPLHFSEAYALSSMVFYLTYLLVVGRVIGLTYADISGRLRESWAYILAWIVGGCLLRGLISAFKLAM